MIIDNLLCVVGRSPEASRIENPFFVLGLSPEATRIELERGSQPAQRGLQ